MAVKIDPQYRQRSFCRYCGAMTRRLDSVCDAHADLVELDRPPDDERESLPMQAADLGEDLQAARERGA